MKEELIRVLNNKLNSINSDIDAIKELNQKIDEENESLDFVNGIINLFNEDGQNNPMNFDKIVKEDFTRVLEIAGDEVKNLFNSGACNYDGLVYLINGIKNGVSITLTNEQLNGIEFLIQKLTEKKETMSTTINGFEQEKSKYEVSDINELKTKKDKYVDVVDGINKNKYLKDIDILKEAINFERLEPSKTIDILSYVLEYNADVFNNKTDVVEEEKKEEVKEEKVETEETNEEVEEVTPEEEDNGFHFNQIENDNVFDLPNITFNDGEKEIDTDVVMPEEVKEEVKEEKEEEYQEYTPVEETNVEEAVTEITPQEVVEEPKETEDVPEEPVTVEATPVEEVTPESPMEPVIENITLPITEEKVEEQVTEEPVTIEPTPVEEVTPEVTPIEETKVEEAVEIPVVNVAEVEKEAQEEIDNDFKDIVTGKDYYEEEIEKEDKTTSTRELHKVFGKYGIEENVVLNELIDGDVNEYQKVLDYLKDKDVLDVVKKNKELLIEILLYSDIEVIDKVLRIIKEDLSVDEEDYEITRKIVINTIPSIFIREGGNYDNFIRNVDLFKNLEINLINLFDFSKEIFVADHETIEENLAVVNKYDFDITYKNAKYFLLIPNIAEKLDYYVESVYQDKTKNETFDGINYIKEYAAKLNVVTDETIKRLRYASTNGKKVFGNKPGSLTGEITNLKVNALDLNSEYLNSFFNNEFKDITPDEVREYIKLIHNSTNVGDYSDELDKLNNYRNGLRYTIEGVNVSYNKVLRNYNVLRSYGIDAKKALQFSVGYNLVITKDEYNKLSELLDNIGGNA